MGRSVSTHVAIRVGMRVYMCRYVFTHVAIRVGICAHMCRYVCRYVSMCVDVWLYVSTRCPEEVAARVLEGRPGWPGTVARGPGGGGPNEAWKRPLAGADFEGPATGESYFR